jgi:hypothetical protein
MKSFYKFLSSRLEFGETLDVNRKPVFRSSAIFPAIQTDFYTTNIMFLGYWLIKRKIREITILITLRSKDGKIVTRNTLLVDSPKSYSIELNSLLQNTSNKNSEFFGSIELEIFSTQDMVFPYPALVLQYYGENFNTCVHTLGRIYNDFEDLHENEVSRVPESGFDISCSKDLEPFVSFVNGPISNSNALFNYVITNSESEKFSGSFNLGEIQPYETMLLKLKENIPNLDKILKNKSGSITLEHNLEGFFPRFLAGNFQNSLDSLSFTHTFYDCSSSHDISDYWDRATDEFYDCSVYVPIFIDNNQYTELVIYPNFSPSEFDLDISLHDSDGKQVYLLESFLSISSNDSKLFKINFNEIIQNLDIDKHKVKTAHLISNFKNKIPSRLKFGLNIGQENMKSKIPCNICFNSKTGNPFLEKKPGSFHWCPIFNNENAVVSVANFSPKKNYTKSANVVLKFYNNDSIKLEKKIILQANSEYRIDTSTVPELKTIIENEPIWVTIEADNPNIQGFYFNFHKSGSVAGDHFF